jgi:hypothetical protein
MVHHQTLGISSGGEFCTCLDSPISLVSRATKRSSFSSMFSAMMMIEKNHTIKLSDRLRTLLFLTMLFLIFSYPVLACHWHHGIIGSYPRISVAEVVGTTMI